MNVYHVKNKNNDQINVYAPDPDTAAAFAVKIGFVRKKENASVTLSAVADRFNAAERAGFARYGIVGQEACRYDGGRVQWQITDENGMRVCGPWRKES